MIQLFVTRNPAWKGRGGSEGITLSTSRRPPLSPSPSFTFQLIPVSFPLVKVSERQDNIHPTPRATSTPLGSSSRCGLHLLSPSPLPQQKGLGAERRSGSSAASGHMPQRSRSQRNVVDWEALRHLQPRGASAAARFALPIPSHPASPLKKGIKSKTGICFHKVSQVFSPPPPPAAAVPLAPQQHPLRGPSLPAVVLCRLVGGLGLGVRGGPLEALGGDGCLVGHALPHDVSFPPEHHLLQ